MQRHHRIRLLALAAVVVIAGSVWVASDRQRSVAEASSREANGAQQMRTLILSRAADLAAYASTGQSQLLRDAVQGEEGFEVTAVKVRDSADELSPRKLRLLRAQERAGQRWSELADAVTTDLVGEEFLALLPDTDGEGAMHVAQKLRTAIAQIDVPGVSRRVTASFGVAVLPFDAVEPEQLLRVADRALYQAKGNGRDRVEVAALSSGEDG